MPTEDYYIPSIEELTVPELELTSPVLRAGSLYFGKYCDSICKEYMLCYLETRDPRKCLQEGKEVTRCGFEFFGKVKANCQEEFNRYWQCLDHSGGNMNFNGCRKTQAVFDKCAKEKLGIERPPVGYFSKTRVHHTDRPKPTIGPQIVPPAVPPVPDLSNKGIKAKRISEDFLP